jgi:photosystem II stability/assembly factor-like uncharacterized protein
MRYKKLSIFTVFCLLSLWLLILSFVPAGGASRAASRKKELEADADLPARLDVEINKADYLRRRAEAVAMKRGMFDDPTGKMRARAIDMLSRQELQQRQNKSSNPSSPDVIAGTWTPLGPDPIPNGQGQSGALAVSGRTIAIAIHPTDPNIAYVGTAQGGLYLTKDGGVTWKALMDNALSLAIGSLMLVPGDPTTLWVGTGECGFSADSFFGYGVYRIRNADTNAILEGPFNKDAATGLTDLMTGRAADGIAVDPNNPNVLYVATSSGIGGVGGDLFGNAPARGLFKSTNATSANPTFTKLAIGSIAAGTDQRVMDILFEPGSSDNLILTTVALSGTLGGVWRTTNATNAAPTFTQTLSITSIPASSGLTRCELTQTKLSGVTTVYAASSENSGAATCGTNGTLRKSTDGGATWSAPIAGGNGFCSTQCFYNIAVDVNPTDPNNVMLGGNIIGSCSKAISRSTNGGATFSNTPGNGVHADNHVVKFAPSNPSILYEGNDGGIFKSTDGGVTFFSLNNKGFNATQFESVSVHPSNQYFTIGGTQDNGTEQLKPAGTPTPEWTNADGGDGGFALIDKSAPDTENVNMYHTYFNQANNLIGFARMTKASCIPTKDWAFRGACGSGGNDPTPTCDGTQAVLANGMTCGDAVEFYAPMALGPGTPNTLYYGTSRLYRSANRGDTMPAVSQLLGSTMSAIGISPQNDDVRIVGTRAGTLFLTTTGSNPLTNVTGAIPAKYIARTVIDPNSTTTAYVTLAGFGTTASPIQHVWKTTGLSEAGTAWTAASTGLPDDPVNGFAVDVNDPAHPGVSVLYAGLDIGVYRSTDSGASWSPFGTGLPRVAVFDMAIQPTSRTLRIATHGRGMWEIGLPGALQLTGADSIKKHGTAGAGTIFPIAMPLTATLFNGTSGVEDRQGGDSDGGGAGEYKIVLHFTNPVTAGGASVSAHNPGGSAGSVGSVSFSGTDMTVRLTGVTNAQVLTLTATNITDGINMIPSVDVNVGFLVGDTTGSRNVNATDVSQTKAASGVALTGANFRTDVTHSGVTNSSDIGTVKLASGTALP